VLYNLTSKLYKEVRVNNASKLYTRQFISAMLAYAILLIVAVVLVERVSSTPLRVLLALLPVVPTMLGLFAFIRFLNQMDELQQRIQLSAIAFASGATAMLTFAYGLLESLADFSHIPWTFVFPLMVLLWGLGLAVAARRYQ
jgi:uncharacterized protein YacL